MDEENIIEEEQLTVTQEETETASDSNAEEIIVNCDCPDYTDELSSLLQELQELHACSEALQQQLELQNGQNEQQAQMLIELKEAYLSQNDAVNDNMNVLIVLLLLLLCLKLRELSKSWKKMLFGFGGVS